MLDIDLQLYLNINRNRKKKIKIEAEKIAKERSKVIIEYIIQILTDPIKVNGIIEFDSAKINNLSMCTLNIYVPEKNFERHLNLGITTDHAHILHNQFLTDLIDEFLESETINISQYYQTLSIPRNFFFFLASNKKGSTVKIIHITTLKAIDDYNQKYFTYLKSRDNAKQPKKSI